MHPWDSFLDWLNLLLRWAHVVAGIAWIGGSFYLIWRAERLAPPEPPRAPHAFKWEAYWTWITGFALLVAMVYVNAEAYLIDPAVMPLSKPAAIGIGTGSLIISLAVYEAICRSPLGRNDLLLGIGLFALAALFAWGLAQVFSVRGAFIHYGAILGTLMAGNIAHVIVPGERRRAAAIAQGREPDARDALIGRQRSAHNTYFTLPVVFAMISSHHATALGNRWDWVVLAGTTLAGVLLRFGFGRVVPRRREVMGP